MQNEEQLRQAEELRKKTVETLYKQLTRCCIPISSSIQRLPGAKNKLFMQELTVAYRNNDMHTLLRLELNGSRVKKATSNG